MAIVKVTRYTKDRHSAKAVISYITQRPGKDNRAITRELFNYDGALDRHLAYRMIDEAKRGTIFYPIVISPDPNTEDGGQDLHLLEITKLTMLQLEEQLKTQIRFVATEHNDHSPNRHVHVLALLPRRLNRQDLRSLRLAATEAAVFQRRERDLWQEQARGFLVRGIAPIPKQRSSGRSTAERSQVAGAKLRRGRGTLPIQICPRCGSAQVWHRGICTSCGQRLRHSQVKEAEWQL